MAADDVISRDEAMHRVGQAMFSESWGDGLTAHHQLLLERYGRGHVSRHSELLPGGITYIDDRTGFGLSPAMLADVQAARYRYERCTLVNDWLDSHGFIGAKFSRSQFEASLAAGFAVQTKAVPNAPASPKRSGKAQPMRGLAKKILGEAFPDGVPDQNEVSNKILVQKVARRLKELSLPDLKEDSILRVAGRRK